MDKLPVTRGSYGYNITFTIYQNPRSAGIVKPLAGYTITLKVWPYGSTSLSFSRPCSMVGDGTAGQCTYTVIDGNFDVLGTFKAEVRLTKVGVNEPAQKFLIEVEETAPTS